MDPPAKPVAVVERVARAPAPDVVLVFSLETLGPKGAEQAPKAAEQAARSAEYARLLERLGSVGLVAVGRPGSAGSQTVLVLVTAGDRLVDAQAKKERVQDYLYAVGSCNLNVGTITPAERVRHIYSLVTLDARITVGSQEFPSVRSIFPPADHEFSHAWISQWTSVASIFAPPQLDEARAMYGEQIAMYFAFLRSYFLALAFPSALSFLFWAAGKQYSQVFGVMLVGWAIVFVESWRIKERTLASRWGCYGLENLPLTRAEFKPDRKEVNPATGEEVLTFAWHKSLVRQLSTVPVVFLFSIVLGMVISTIYTIETLVGEIYSGPAKSVVMLLPTVLFVGLVPRFTAVWHTIAIRLTNFENFKKPHDHATALARKLVALNFLVAYGGLILSAFIYIPYGHLLVPRILSLLPSHTTLQSCLAQTGEYSINPARLKTQLVAYTLTGQISGAFSEIALPEILRFLGKKVHRTKEVLNEDEEGEEHEMLQRIREEATLPEYSLVAEYTEMVVQFGYVTLWVSIWPLAATMSFVNNFFEQRGDAYKLCKQAKRPIPARAATIGPWLDALSTLSYIAGITTTSLIYLFQPFLHPLSSGSPTTLSLLKSATNSTLIFSPEGVPLSIRTTLLSLAISTTLDPTLPKQLNESSISSHPILAVLLQALLLGLLGGQVVLAVRWGVRNLLEEASWKGSEMARRLVEQEFLMRRNWVRSSEAEVQKEKEEVGGEEERRGIWKVDKGLEEILRRGKTE